MAARLQDRLTNHVPLHLQRTPDRSQPPGQRGLPRRQTDRVGHQGPPHPQCAGGRTVPGPRISQGLVPDLSSWRGSMKRLRLPALLICLLVPACVPISQAEPPPKPADKPARYEVRKDHDPDGIGKFYMGREIAQVMGHLAADWLERHEREREEEPVKLMEALGIKPGDVIADVGAGSGYFTFRLSERVGPKGKVLANDIQQEMLDIIAKRMKDKEVKNIELIRGTESDPKLPASAVDLILLVDVYHEFEYPFEMTEAMVRSLKPGGRLV